MAVSMTDAAKERVNSVKKRRQTPDAILRVGVRGGGCSGLEYYVDLVPEAQPKDKLFEFDSPQGKIVLAVDRKSYLFLNGSELDFKKGMMHSGFEFHNPLASRSCSCGDSFTL
ncbi:iron-sulfur cluster assembly accessory protein [Myxococcota bacterium]|nr:iron-sulfur cluster assembly accessory protein [Myxococcota bacterium]